MYRHILLPTDGSEQASAAIAAGVTLAAQLGAEVTGLHIEVDTGIAVGLDRVMHDDPQEIHAGARLHLDVVSTEARRQRVPFHCYRLAFSSAADGIVETARARGCDLIVMASHGHTGVARLLMGSVTRQVLDRCTVPVLVYR